MKGHSLATRMGLAAGLAAAVSCAGKSPLRAQLCINPDAQLAALLVPLEDARCAQSDEVECGRLQREVEHLAVVCPAHAPTLLASAVLAYEHQQPAKAQQLLDDLLSQPRSQPDAAVLRARIAIEEGNVSFASRLIDQQLQLAPDHAGLHETYAAAFYIESKMTDAARELGLAGTLGAPRWRIAYHLGLIEESAGHLDAALRLYEEALQAHPNWATAESRIKALRARLQTP